MPQIGIQDLPEEILLLILSYLIPEDIVSIVSRLNKDLNRITKDNIFWRNELKLHFPYKWKKDSNINYYNEFSKIYTEEYKEVEASARSSFSMVIKGDIESLTNRPVFFGFLDAVRHGGSPPNGQSLLKLAQKMGKQSVLDVFYCLAKAHYANAHSILGKTTTILYWAIACHQKVPQIKALISKSMYLSEEYFYMKSQPIHIAAEEGLLDVIQYFIERRPSLLNQRDIFGRTPLMIAAELGHLAVVKYLLNQPNVELNYVLLPNSNNLPDDVGKSAFHLAAANGHSEVVSALIKAGANATTQYHPIHLAAQNGHLEVIKVLIEHDPNALNRVDRYGQTPLIWVASRGHLLLVEWLLKQPGIDLHAVTHPFWDSGGMAAGRTALHWAAINGHSEIVSALIKAGAHIQAASMLDQSRPVHLAARHGHLKVVKILIENNPNIINVRNHNGDTALLLAARVTWHNYQDQLAVIEFLLKQPNIEIDDHTFDWAARVKIVNEKALVIFIHKLTLLLSTENCLPDRLQEAIQNKNNICERLLSLSKNMPFFAAQKLLKKAISVDKKGEPNTQLSRVMHHNTTLGFFSPIASIELNKIKNEIRERKKQIKVQDGQFELQAMNNIRLSY